MSVSKRRYTAGERAAPVPGHGGMYRMSDDNGWYWVGQGPRPFYRPSRAELLKAGIDPDNFAEKLWAAHGPDLRDDLGRPTYTPRPSEAPTDVTGQLLLWS